MSSRALSPTKIFLLALTIRSLSLFSQTYFQPDEFYQSLEPAHHLVYGYGALTWEWRDLPEPSQQQLDDLSFWQRGLVNIGGSGRLRSWSWPSLFAGVYWLLEEVKVDSSFFDRNILDRLNLDRTFLDEQVLPRASKGLALADEQIWQKVKAHWALLQQTITAQAQLYGSKIDWTFLDEPLRQVKLLRTELPDKVIHQIQLLRTLVDDKVLSQVRPMLDGGAGSYLSEGTLEKVKEAGSFLDIHIWQNSKVAGEFLLERLLERLKLDRSSFDETALFTLAPRIPPVIIAALTDLYTAKLAGKVLGPSSQNTALFLSLTSLFNSHALPRALSTSAETFLTVAALCYWPLPGTFNRASTPNPYQLGRTKIRTGNNLVLSLILSALAFSLRPTGVVLWLLLGLELCRREGRIRGTGRVLGLLGLVAAIGTTVLSLSTYLDYKITGKLYLPFLSFLTQNVVLGISKFYGSSSWHYHFTQTIPILLTTTLPFFLPSYFSVLRSTLSSRKRVAQSKPGLKVLAVTTALTVVIWSMISHKEWRFLHPLLPVFLLFPTFYFTRSYNPSPKRSIWNPILRKVGINRSPFLFLLLTPIAPMVYLAEYHGRAQVEVTEFLRSDAPGEGESREDVVAVLMPCHSIPWQSHVHRKDLAVEGAFWSLGCEPPLGVSDKSTYRTEEQAFYDNPTKQLSHILSTGSLLGQPPKRPPTHVVMFGSLLDEEGTEEALAEFGFDEVWYSWNGFDVLQDEEKRRGGVTVWTNDNVLLS